MEKEDRTVIFDNLLDWAPASDVTSDPAKAGEGVWLLRRGVYGSSSGALLCNAAHGVPELSFDPGLKGWHQVFVRVHHPMLRILAVVVNDEHDAAGVYAGTSKDRALRVVRPELATEAFETLSLSARDMTGARMRLDGTYVKCEVDSVRFVPCPAPKPLPPAEKEVCAINDYADCPDDYRPMEQCAAESVRVHAEAGFTTIFWKAYAVRCEYHTRIGEMRSSRFQKDRRVSIGNLLEKYDTLDAAVAEAKACGVKMLGWMRINNEFHAREGEWSKFGGTTAFHNAHPEMRQRYKNGEFSPRLSFAWPEVRQYLCSLGREILDRGMDGLIIDVLRHPSVVQYDKPIVDEFIRKTGQNPMEMEGDGTEEWLRFRARAFTDLLRDFRNMMNGSGHKDKPIYVRTIPEPWRNLRDGCDVDAWLEEKLVDTIVIGHHCVSGPGHPWQDFSGPMKQLIAGRARLVVQVMRISEMPTALELAREAYKHGADGTAIYESNIVVTLPTQRDAIKRLRSARL